MSTLNSSTDSFTDPIVKQNAQKFLKRPNFHRTLRTEILFAIAPRTLKSDERQKRGVYNVMRSLQFGGFLRDEGFKQLGTIIEVSKIIGRDLQFKFKKPTVEEFCRSGEVSRIYSTFI